MDLILNTIRKIDHDQVKELSFGDETSLKENLAIGLMNSEVMKKLNVPLKSNIKITSEFGSVVIKVKEDKEVPSGMICVPVSIWANQITGVSNEELSNKNVNISVESTGESILSFQEIISKIKGI